MSFFVATIVPVTQKLLEVRLCLIDSWALISASLLQTFSYQTDTPNRKRVEGAAFTDLSMYSEAQGLNRGPRITV